MQPVAAAVRSPITEDRRPDRLDPPADRAIAALQSTWMASGSGPGLADRQALAGVWGMVQRQASMLSFRDTFIVLTLVFVTMIPLVALFKKPREGPTDMAAH